MDSKKGFLSFISKNKKIGIGIIILLLGVGVFVHYQNSQVDHLIKNHTYKIMVEGPDKSGDTVKQAGVLIFNKDTYKKGSNLDEDFSDLNSLISSAQENDSSSYTANKDAITLNTGYSDDTPSNGEIAKLKNLKASNGGKTIKGEITYQYEDDSAVENNENDLAAYDNISTKTAHATVQLERIK